MGQDISKSLNPPPLSLQDCLVNGNLDLTHYVFYKRKMDLINDNLSSHPLRRKRKLPHESNIKKSVHSCLVKKHKLLARKDDGSLRELTPEDTLWYLKYVKTPSWNDRLKKQFRSRFRMPYESFIDLHESIDNHPLFQRWKTKDATGVAASNTKLLLLGTLRYIGRSWTLDDLEEANGISREVNCIFLNTFLKYVSTI